MVHTHHIEGLEVRTGDLICTTDGGGALAAGEIWRLIGRLIPGDTDHIVVYVGPGGRCVEAGGRLRVIEFEVPDGTWDADRMYAQRRMLDTLHGVACPLEDRGLSDGDADAIRRAVARYVLDQAAAGKPYNINFLNPDTDDAFYCSQLAYKAYLPHGINLNTGLGVPHIPGTSRIIFPEEIWTGCPHRAV